MNSSERAPSMSRIPLRVANSMVRLSLFLVTMGSLTLRIDWVPLSLKGSQRGEVYLEMTFFAAGPAPLTRRPTKFTSPSERLGRPQQPVTQPPHRATSQPQPQPQPTSSTLAPQGQQGSRYNAQEVPRQRPPRGQQVRLPGAWPGPSAQNQPLPPDPEPKQEFVPSILRPGGPSPSHSGNTSPNAHPTQPRPGQQNPLPPLPGSAAPQNHITLSSPSLEAQPSHAGRVSSYSSQGSPGHGGYAHPTTQHSPQTQPEPPHAHHNLPSQPSPQQRQQTQHPASQPAPYASPYPPNNHSAVQTHVPPHTSTPPVPSYVATQSPAPSGFSYVASTPSPAPPAHLHMASSSHPPPAQTRPATLSPVPPVHQHAASIGAASPSPPALSYPVTSVPHSRPPAAHSSPVPTPQLYTASPVPFTSPYPVPTSPGPQAQPYVSPLGSVLTHPVQSPSSPPHTQSYFAPPNAAFPLPTSPPPIPSYGHTAYDPAPAFSFPVPHSTVDYFGSSASPPPPAPFSGPADEPELPDPYLLKRYQTPLPLPPGQSTQPKPPASATAAAAPPRRQDESERAARELQRLEEERARARREQEERDAELARTLDLELNMDGSGPGASMQGGQDRPSLPPRRPEAVGGHRSAMPGAW